MGRVVRIRQQSVLSRLSSWPVDLFFQLAEEYSVLDLDSISKRLTIPAGLLINFLYWLCRVQASYLQKSSTADVFQRKGSSGTGSNRSIMHGGTWWYRFMWTISFVFVCLSLFNTWYCFTRTRNYQIQSKGSSGLSTPKRRVTSVMTQTEHSGWNMFSHFSPFSLRRKQVQNRRVEKEELHAWNPSIASLRAFSVFSPLHVFLIWNCPRNVAVLVGILLLSAQTLYLVDTYEQHIEDKRLIYGQVLHEYDKSYVEPRLSVRKRDVGTGTRPDDNGVYVEVHTPRVGITDARRPNAVPNSVNTVRLYDWEGAGSDFPTSPNVVRMLFDRFTVLTR